MTGPPDQAQGPGRARRSGRRSGDSGTREAILAAARAKFGDLGYDRATIRGIAADAGVDAALVHHFFGSKEKLFGAAMQLPVDPGDVVDSVLASAPAGPGASLGEHFLRTLLGIWDVAEIRATFMGLLRSASTSEQNIGMLREFVTSVIISRLARVIQAADPDCRDAEYRASLCASQVLGLGMARYVIELGPLKQATTDDLVAAIGPTLDRYLSGPVR